jgi:hypothetical protein
MRFFLCFVAGGGTLSSNNMGEVVKKGLPNVKGWNQFFVRCKGK